MKELEDILVELCKIHSRVLNYGQDALAELIEDVCERLDTYIEERE